MRSFVLASIVAMAASGAFGQGKHPADAKSTADMNGCSDSEKAVWDNILNETYRQLREKLVGEQQEKLRDMQRAWIASRDKTCAFYWDYYQGTMASPMAAACVNRETAQRAQFLVGFLYATKDK